MDYQIDYAAVNRDFFCVKVTGKRVAQGEPALPYRMIQDLSDAVQPLSVMHQFGKNVYMLFGREATKPAAVLELLRNVQRSDEYLEKELTFAPIEFTGSSGMSFDTHLTGYWVLQILLNTLANADPEKPHANYQNLYGHLFFPVPGGDRKSERDFFEIAVEKHDLLMVKARRFAAFSAIESLRTWQKRKRHFPNVYFVENPTTGALVRSSDPYKDISRHGVVYVNHPYSSKRRVSVPFIDTSSPVSFSKTRIAMYQRFITDVQFLLGPYVTRFQQAPMPDRDYEQLDRPELPLAKRVREYFAEHGLLKIGLIDHCRNQDTERIKTFLERQAKEISIEISETDTLLESESEVPIISITHNKDYYEKEKKDDPYDRARDYMIQHVTVEDFLPDGEDSASQKLFLVLLRDLAIKRDLIRDNADFLSCTESSDNHAFRYQIVDGFGSRHERPMELYSVRIKEDYSIEKLHSQDSMTDFALSLADELDELVQKIRATIGHRPQFDGLVESSSGERNFIFRTDEIVMPDLRVFTNEMDLAAQELPDALRIPDAMAEVVRRILTEEAAKANSERVTELVELLKNQKTLLAKSDFKSLVRKIFSHQSREYRYLVRRLREQHGISFGMSRGKGAHALHEYRSGLRYWEANGLGFYFSGEWTLSGIQAKKAKADHIRVVVPDADSTLFFKRLLQGMNEEIVHLAQRSVLPAGFKYVREYKYNCDANHLDIAPQDI